MKAVLGLKLDPWHDTGAAMVLDDGAQLRVVAISEERLDRVKNSRAFPSRSIAYCLEVVGCRLSDISLVVADYIVSPSAEDYFKGSGQPLPTTKRQFFRELSELGIPVAFAEHHLCHAASAYLATEWDEAAALVIDGHGSYYETQSLFRCQGTALTKVATSHRPGIGWMYGVVTECLLGFAHLQEGKTMGLAGWAKDGGPWQRGFKRQSDPTNPFAMAYEDFLEDGRMWKLKPPAGLPHRGSDQELVQPPFTQYAFAAQAELESAVMELVRSAARLIPSKRLAYAGGVALNIPANRQILDSGLYPELFIQPAASDAGIPLGAALLGYYTMLGGQRRWRMDHAFLAKDYTPKAFQQELNRWPGHRAEYRTEIAAQLLANNYLLAWHQGPSEYGPRALGHRSILCHPGHPQMKAYLNQEVKHREMFRPFAPIVPVAKQSTYFDLPVASPFMLLNSAVHPDQAPLLPAVVHADGTARVQSIIEREQPELHALLESVERLTGIPVLLNTSLNLAGEPIVESPADTVALFARSNLDALALGPHLLTKVPLSDLLQGSNPRLNETLEISTLRRSETACDQSPELRKALEAAVESLRDGHSLLAELRLEEALEISPDNPEALQLLRSLTLSTPEAVDQGSARCFAASTAKKLSVSAGNARHSKET